MKNKKAVALVLGIAMAISLTACGESSDSGAATTPATDSRAEETEQSGDTEGVTTFTAAHASTNESTLGQFFLTIQKYLEENTDDLRMDLYPAGQLGSDTELAESIVENSIQMTSGAAANFVNVVPDLCVFDLPFAYDSYWQMRNASSDPELISALDQVLAEKGLKMGVLRAEGFRTLFSQRPVTCYEDIKGLQIRVMDNKYHISLWTQLGANPTTVAFTELYTALQQGVVEAQENTTTSTLANYNLYEVTNYATISKHEVTVHPFLINLEFYNSLTEQQQQELMDACNYAKENEADLEAGDNESLEMLKKDYGYEVYEFTDEDLEKCREATKGTWTDIQNSVNPDLYNALTAAIEKNKE